jgi:hypothetical protein
MRQRITHRISAILAGIFISFALASAPGGAEQQPAARSTAPMQVADPGGSVGGNGG